LNFRDLHPPEQLEWITDCFQRMGRGEAIGVVTALVVDRAGRQHPVEITGGQPFAGGGRQLMFGVFRNISRRKRIEQAVDFIARHQGGRPRISSMTSAANWPRRWTRVTRSSAVFCRTRLAGCARWVLERRRLQRTD
jgi:hypothetical protein